MGQTMDPHLTNRPAQHLNNKNPMFESRDRVGRWGAGAQALRPTVIKNHSKDDVLESEIRNTGYGRQDIVPELGYTALRL